MMENEKMAAEKKGWEAKWAEEKKLWEETDDRAQGRIAELEENKRSVRPRASVRR